MYKLLKLTKITSFRIFDNFKWNDSVKKFDKVNLFFGWNGVGKSTISDLLFQLSNRIPFKEDETFELMFQNEDSHSLVVTNINTRSENYSLKVFDQNYVDNNIVKVDFIKHIYAVGQGQANAVQRIKDARNTTLALTSELALAKQNLEATQKRHEQLLTKLASNLKNELSLGNSYNRNQYIYDFEHNSSQNRPSRDEYNVLLQTALSPQLTAIEYLSFTPFTEDYEQKIVQILQTKPIISAIETLKNYPKISRWAEEGLALHKEYESSECFFCGNEIPMSRLSDLEHHFNKAYLELINEINDCISKTHEMKANLAVIANIIISTDSFYPELKEPVRIKLDEFHININICTSVLNEIIEILERKRSNIISDETLYQFRVISHVDLLKQNIVNPINELISQNNNIVLKHKDIVNQALEQAKAY